MNQGISLIIGADGLIGRALAEDLRLKGETTYETTRRPGTLTERRLFLNLDEDISDWRPPRHVSTSYLCAAVSSLETCRKKPLQSMAVNVRNLVALAKKLVACGSFVIFPSTNLVFDGSIPFQKANDPVCPQTEYGRQKAEAERQLLALRDSIAIVRLTKVIGPNMSLFKEWVGALQNESPIHAFSDLRIAPISLNFTVDTLCRVAEARLSGILQISGDRDITYEQIARYLAQRLVRSQALVQPVPAESLPAEVPLHTTLDTTRLHLEFGLVPPNVWTVIDSVIN